jgi:hypothetical protein
VPSELTQKAVLLVRGMLQPIVQDVTPGSCFQFSAFNLDYPFRTVPPPAGNEGVVAQLELNPTRDQRAEQGRT